MVSVAVTLEGVIRRPIGGQPIKHGVDLYYSLATRFQLVLITLDAQTEVEYWLQSEGMYEHTRVMYSDPVLHQTPIPEAYYQQVLSARKLGHDVDLVVTPDPSAAGLLFKNGINTLLFSETTYASPHWRPDYKHEVRPWDELSNQVAHEAWLRAQEENKDAA